MNRIKRISLLSCAILLILANTSFPAYAAESKAITSQAISLVNFTGENIGLTPTEPGTSSGAVPFETEVPTKLWDVSKSYYYLSGRSNVGKLYTEHAFYNKYSYSIQTRNQPTSTLIIEIKSLGSDIVYNTVSIPGNPEWSFTVIGTSLEPKIYLEFKANILGYIDMIGTIEQFQNCPLKLHTYDFVSVQFYFCKKRKRMPATVLKIIASVFMVADHTGQFLLNMPTWLYWIGRLSFPVFIFCSTQGSSHTRSRKEYIVRFYFVGAFMEPAKRVVSYSFHAISGFSSPAGVVGNNVLQPLFCLSILYFLIDRFRQKDGSFQKYLPRCGVWQIEAYLFLILLPMVVPATTDFTISAEFLSTLLGGIFYLEGGWVYLLSGVILYWVKDDRKRLARVYTASCAVLFLLLFIQFIPHCLAQLIEILRLPDLYSFFYELCLKAVGIPLVCTPDSTTVLFKHYSWMTLGAPSLSVSYNGQRGKRWKYLFYVLYPLHIFVLYYIGGIFGGAG